MVFPVFLRPLLAAVLVVVLGGLASAQTVSFNLAQLKDQLAAYQRSNRNLDTAIERQQAENARLLTLLDTMGDERGDVTFERLRQAQFEVDIARTRLLTLAHRVTEQSDRVDQLNARIVAASSAQRTNTRDTLQRIVQEAGIDWLGRIRTTATESLEKLSIYQTLSQEYLNLREEQLQILQRAITLTAVQGETSRDDAPLIAQLQILVDSLAQQALTLSNEASAINDSNADAIQRRNRLRLRSDEALLRSNTRLTDIAIIQARGALTGLRPIRDEPAIPIRLFDEAIDELEQEDEQLRQRAETVVLNRDGLSDLTRILSEPSQQEPAATAALRERINGLRALLADQEQEIGELRREIANEIDAFTRARAVRERATLLTRETARTDKAALERVLTEIRQIPAELQAIYSSRLLEMQTAVSVAPKRRHVVFGVLVLAILGMTIYLRQVLLRRFVSANATQATEIPIEVLRRNLFWLFPVAVWMVFAEIYGLAWETTWAILNIIAIPAVAASLRDLTQVIVSRRTQGEQKHIGVIITRATEIAVVLSAAFVLAYVVLNEIDLLPSTQTALNRLAYSVFVLSGLPMLLFVFFFAADRGGGSFGRIRRSVASILSLLPPVALIATGVTGLAGYTRLAAVMLENLGIAIAIIAVLALAMGIINDLVEAITAHIRREDPARAFFARANFLQPLSRAGQAGLVVVAIVAFVRVFDWTIDTPGIKQVVEIWRTKVFTAGTTDYTVGSVLIGALAFAFVFWVAGWSRRVAYTVVFRKLKDIGIRQSLSVFAQYVVVVVGVLLTLSAIGFDVTTLTVFAASLGVGIGFGLQNVVNNFISGLLLLVERPLRIGDIVTVGANSGTVMQIGIRSMRMKTFDEFDLIVPNSALISDTFTNWTRTNSVMRVLIPVGISYSDDPDLAVKIIYEVLGAHPGVLKSPEPMVTVDEFGDNSINLRVCYYIDLYGNFSGFVVKSEVLTTVVRRFGESGLSIPFPQRDIHVIAPKGASAGSTTPVAVSEGQPSKSEWIADAIEDLQSGGDRDD